MLVRALTTLIGLASAAALLLLVPDTGSAEGGGLWKRAALLAAAGFVAGFFYQLGGVRRPGVRVNVPVLVAGVLPWTLLAIAICAQRAGTPAFLTDLVRDVAARQRAQTLVAVVPDPRVHERPAAGVRARRAARRRAHRGARRDRRGRGRRAARTSRSSSPAASAGRRFRRLGPPAACACSASTSSATACTRRRELRAVRRSVVEGRCAVDAVASHHQPDRPLDHDAAVEGQLELVDDLVVPLGEQRFGEARLEQAVVGLQRRDLARVPGTRALAVEVERADRRAQTRRQPEHRSHRLVARARRGAPASALPWRGRPSSRTCRSTNASTHGPSPACSCAISSRRATSSLDAT